MQITFLMSTVVAVASLGLVNALPQPAPQQSSAASSSSTTGKYGSFAITVTKADSTSCTVNIVDKNSVSGSPGQQKATCTINNKATDPNAGVHCTSGSWLIGSAPSDDGTVQEAYINHFVRYKNGIQSAPGATPESTSQGPVYRVRTSQHFPCYGLGTRPAGAQGAPLNTLIEKPAGEYSVPTNNFHDGTPYDFIAGTGLAVSPIDSTGN